MDCAMLSAAVDQSWTKAEHWKSEPNEWFIASRGKNRSGEFFKILGPYKSGDSIEMDTGSSVAAGQDVGQSSFQSNGLVDARMDSLQLHLRFLKHL